MPPAFLWQLDAVSLEPARLCDISVKFAPGVTAVLGWSGAGKTSLLNLLAGFETPTRGQIGGAIRAAWVPQNGGLWPHCTAREHLKIARRGTDGIAELLAQFDLADKAEARPHELSEGEQSRLAVARALAAQAPVLVMDEPLVHVDPARAGKYWSHIRAHLAATKASLVFATHVPELVLGEAERVICLRAGRLLHEGSVADLYARPTTAELMTFLGPGNWLTPAEARLWLGEKIDLPRCFRPEQIEVVSAEKSEAVVQRSTFCGSVAEVELRHETATTHRTFTHRPSSPHLASGARVAVRLRR